MINTLILITTLSTSLLFAKSNSTTLSGTVLNCHDGDTCRVLTEKDIISVRFSGIDCPELKQPNGKQARDFTSNLLKKKDVQLECDGKSFKRITCTVFLEGKDINAEIVKTGYAFDVPKYSKGKYREMMIEAKSRGLGIWKDNPISPYCFRHKNNHSCKSDPTFMGK